MYWPKGKSRAVQLSVIVLVEFDPIDTQGASWWNSPAILLSYFLSSLEPSFLLKYNMQLASASRVYRLLLLSQLLGFFLLFKRTHKLTHNQTLVAKARFGGCSLYTLSWNQIVMSLCHIFEEPQKKWKKVRTFSNYLSFTSRGSSLFMSDKPDSVNCDL